MYNIRYNNNDDPQSDYQMNEYDYENPRHQRKKKVQRSSSLNSPNIFKNVKSSVQDQSKKYVPLKTKKRRVKLNYNPITPIAMKNDHHRNNAYNSDTHAENNDRNNYYNSNNAKTNANNNSILPPIESNYRNKTPTKAQVLFHKVNLIEDKMEYVFKQARKMEVLHDMFHKMNNVPYDKFTIDYSSARNRNSSMNSSMNNYPQPRHHHYNNRNYEEDIHPLKNSRSVIRHYYNDNNNFYSGNNSDMEDLSYQLRNLRNELRNRLLRMEVNQHLNQNNNNNNTNTNNNNNNNERFNFYKPNKYLY